MRTVFTNIKNEKLYEEHSYLNKDITFIKSNIIREYDIKSAGMNVLFREKAISEERYIYLSSLDKLKRNIIIGNMMREDKELSKILKHGMVKVRREFFESNNIKNEEVLSIKNDALFIINKVATICNFDNVTFSNKNIYSSYYYLNKCEFYYYIRNDKIDVKGVTDNVLHYHEEYMLDFLRIIFKLAEKSTNPKLMQRKIRDFSLSYKNMELPVEYYRELNSDSLYKIYGKKYNYNNIYIHDMSEEFLKNIDISYNYIRYILPLINIFF